MPISKPIVYPLELACPKCRVIVHFTENSPIPIGDIAVCPACKTPCISIDAANQMIIDEYRAKQ